MEFLRSSPGGRVFTPKPSVSDKGHFISWLECCTQSEMKLAFPALAEGSASTADGTAKLCKRGCQWIFTSAAALERDNLLLHAAERRAEQQAVRRQRKRAHEEDAGSGEPPLKQFKCQFVLPDGSTCDFAGETEYQLRKHKDSAKHKRRRSQNKN